MRDKPSNLRACRAFHSVTLVLFLFDFSFGRFLFVEQIPIIDHDFVFFHTLRL